MDDFTKYSNYILNDIIKERIYDEDQEDDDEMFDDEPTTGKKLKRLGTLARSARELGGDSKDNMLKRGKKKMRRQLNKTYSDISNQMKIARKEVLGK